MEVELGCGLQVAVHDPALEIDDAHVLGAEFRQHAAGGRDRHPLIPARAHVPGCSRDEPRRGQAASGRRNLLPLPLEHGAMLSRALQSRPDVALNRLSDEDARILALESPTIAGHMCKLLIVERPLDVEALQRHVAALLSKAPRLGQRLARTPFGIANPVWVDDDAFDITKHVRRVEAEEPVDRERLLQITADLIAERLDRSRPLWRLDVVERLTAEHSAL